MSLTKVIEALWKCSDVGISSNRHNGILQFPRATSKSNTSAKNRLSLRYLEKLSLFGAFLRLHFVVIQIQKSKTCWNISRREVNVGFVFCHDKMVFFSFDTKDNVIGVRELWQREDYAVYKTWFHTFITETLLISNSDKCTFSIISRNQTIELIKPKHTGFQVLFCIPSYVLPQR